MSIRHRLSLALSRADMAADYSHDVINTDKMATFVFKEARSADMVAQILRTIFKRPTLIHKGRKP